MRRRGFGAIFMVMLAVVLLFIWAGSQHFVTSSVRRRVRLAESERAATLMALSSAEQIRVLFPLLLQMQASGSNPLQGSGELFNRNLSGWPFDQPVRVPVKLPWMAATMKHVEIKTISTDAVLYPPEAFEGPAQLGTDLAGFPQARRTLCDQYLAFVEDQSRQGHTPEDGRFLRQRAIRFPGWKNLKIQGVTLFEAQTRADGTGTPLIAKAQLLQQYELTTSPCPGIGEDPPLFQYQIHPVELGRVVEIERGRR